MQRQIDTEYVRIISNDKKEFIMDKRIASNCK